MKTVTTEQFWEYMSRHRFRRIDLQTGIIDGELIKTIIPPELTDIPDKAIKECLELLTVKDTWLTKLIDWCYRLFAVK